VRGLGRRRGGWQRKGELTMRSCMCVYVPACGGTAASPFQGLDKATVLQETKIFSDANTVTRHPKKCCQLITKLLHILTQGEPFTSAETTAVFFGVTKLFQSKDANLRRMMYLFIKEVAEATAADEVCSFSCGLSSSGRCSDPRVCVACLR
jgi:hypothetical protein